MYEKGTEEMTRSPRITSKTGSPIEIWKVPTVGFQSPHIPRV